MNSRDKGKRGELEFAGLLREHGFGDARRGQQFAGGADSPDVVCDALAWLHIEVKREQKLRLAQAVEQAKRDSGGKPWLVAHRVNRGRWLITMDGRDLSKLLQRVAPFLDLEPFAAPWLTLEAELVLQLLRISMREPFGGADGAVVAGNRTEGTEGTNGSVPGGTPATTGRRPAPPEK